MVLVLNMIDEAEDRGIAIDSEGISKLFGIPVVEMIAIYGKARTAPKCDFESAQSLQSDLALLPRKSLPIHGWIAYSALLTLEWHMENYPELNKTIAIL